MHIKSYMFSAALVGFLLTGLPDGMAAAEESAPVSASYVSEGQVLSVVQGYLKEKNYMAIVALTTDLMKTNPNASFLYRMRSAAYVMMGNLDLALADAETYKKMAPNDMFAFLNRGAVYALKDRYQEAEMDFAAAKQMAKAEGRSSNLIRDIELSEANVFNGEAREALANGDNEAALALAQKSIALQPKWFPSYLTQADAYRAMGMKKEAHISELKGLAIHFEENGKYDLAGALYTDLKDYDKAVEVMGKAIAANPIGANYTTRGIAYAESGRNEEAIADFTKAIELSPTSMAYNNRGETYRTMKKYDLAEKDFEKGYALDGNNAALLDSMGMLYYDEGNDEKAVEFLTRAIEKEPYSRTYEYRGKAYERLGKTDLAKADAQKAAELKEKEETEGIIH